MEGNPTTPLSPERREKEPRIVGKITIMRHGATDYNKDYPGINELGKQQMRQNAELLKERIGSDDHVTFVATPKVRTQGSIDIIKEELGKADQETRISKSIRSLEVSDEARAGQLRIEHQAEGTIHDWENKWSSLDIFDEDGPFEKRSDIAARSHGSLNQAIRGFYKFAKEHPGGTQTPHIISVSHFEVLNKFLIDTFGMDPATAELIRYGEIVEIDVLEPEQGKENDEAMLRVKFRGQERTVKFNRTTRNIEPV